MTTTRPLSWSEHAATSFLARAAYARKDWHAFYVAQRAMGKLVGYTASTMGPRLSEGQARRKVRRSLVPVAIRSLLPS